MTKYALWLLAACFLITALAGPARAQQRKAVYLTLAGPAEIVLSPSGYALLVNGRTIIENKNGDLTVQASMSVGEPRNGFDALLLRRGVGDPKCPVVYDLVAVGEDGKCAAAQGFNNCSRLLDAVVGSDQKLYFLVETPAGKKDVFVYDDAARRQDGLVSNVKMRRVAPTEFPKK